MRWIYNFSQIWSQCMSTEAHSAKVDILFVTTEVKILYIHWILLDTWFITYSGKLYIRYVPCCLTHSKLFVTYLTYTQSVCHMPDIQFRGGHTVCPPVNWPFSANKKLRFSWYIINWVINIDYIQLYTVCWYLISSCKLLGTGWCAKGLYKVILQFHPICSQLIYSWCLVKFGIFL